MFTEKIEALRVEGLAAFASVTTENERADLEIRFLGRKSELNMLLKGLKDLTSEEKRLAGPSANEAKQVLGEACEMARVRLAEASVDWDGERIDVTLPPEAVLKGIDAPLTGHIHPLTRVEREIEDIFVSMGFGVADGPEVETEFYNFDAVNMPKDHPARDMQDTFWVRTGADEERLALRTQTSAVQVRYMQTHTPPFRVIIPGRVFRNESTDATHEHTFYQFECLMVDTDVTVAHFKYVAEEFFSKFFGQSMTIRLRPSFFPFVEPGFEFDFACTMCHGTGCSACKHVGWIEIGGAGMVHQKVFEAAGYPRDAYQGFAWGFGLSRLAMLKYQIPDNRLFMSGDMRFLKQF